MKILNVSEEFIHNFLLKDSYGYIKYFYILFGFSHKSKTQKSFDKL